MLSQCIKYHCPLDVTVSGSRNRCLVGLTSGLIWFDTSQAKYVVTTFLIGFKAIQQFNRQGKSSRNRLKPATSPQVMWTKGRADLLWLDLSLDRNLAVRIAEKGKAKSL